MRHTLRYLHPVLVRPSKGFANMLLQAPLKGPVGIAGRRSRDRVVMRQALRNRLLCLSVLVMVRHGEQRSGGNGSGRKRNGREQGRAA